MKKIFALCLTLTLLAFAGIWTPSAASANDSELQIVKPIGDRTLLMNDGSIWTWDSLNVVHTLGNYADAAGKDDQRGLALTKDGRVASWWFGRPAVLANTSGVRQITVGYFLKSDGTVWTENGQVKGYSDIALIDAYDSFFAALTRKGEVLYREGMDSAVKSLGMATDPSSVTSVAVTNHMVALLYAGGKVVIYDTVNFDDNGRIIPVTATEDAVHIVYAAKTATPSGESDKLIITRKDGSVWITGKYNKRFTPTTKIEGLADIVKTAACKDENRFYALKSSGDWVLYHDGEISPVEVPSVKALTVSLSNPEPNVGESVQVDIQETYTNGAKIKASPTDAVITVEKPHLLKKTEDGTLKVLGVGETNVSITSGGQTASVKVSSVLGHNLKFAKQVNGVAYVPLKPVIQALGGTVAKSTEAGVWEIRVGETALKLKTGDVNAVVNDRPLRMKAAMIADGGENYVPASLIADPFGATVKWVDKWKQVEIAFGKSVLTVVSKDTAALVKKAAQGSLAAYIGKSYWVNHFQDYDRFQKVTIADVLPDDTGDFRLVFKTSSGQKLTSYPMKASYVPELLGDSDSFLTYDPYKKYKWSASVWKHVVDGEVTLGMTKDQVALAWGSPASKTITNANGKTIEVWVYGNFDAVGFVNGSVALIYS
ncbi:copper amine oxidase N-terminal domain-containing protein [Cohnella caldifontis]|uniref:copper amine oxidase N-terminal domain-containing protein n=1 Tax=Cohnella caldifontis TaxID=3027471 RepID=UPI0023EA9E47|nr:copper amine oxidase N-terminal domain-containing protein [Cohnella sp. YIM B05605]